MIFPPRLLCSHQLSTNRNFGAIGHNDQAAIGPSYGMELYSNLYPTLVATKYKFGSMSEQTLHFHLVGNLQIPTHRANFTYDLKRKGFRPDGSEWPQ